MNKMIENYKCLPKNLTFSNIDLFNTKFCENSSFEKSLKSKCNKDCYLSCEESFFSTDSKPSERHKPRRTIVPLDEKYITYIYKELMTITHFLTAIGGLLGLWNNLSVYDLQVFLIDFTKKFVDSALIYKFSIYLFSLKWFRLSRTITKLFLNFVLKRVNIKVRVSKFKKALMRKSSARN